MLFFLVKWRDQWVLGSSLFEVWAPTQLLVGYNFKIMIRILDIWSRKLNKKIAYEFFGHVGSLQVSTFIYVPSQLAKVWWIEVVNQVRNKTRKWDGVLEIMEILAMNNGLRSFLLQRTTFLHRILKRRTNDILINHWRSMGLDVQPICIAFRALAKSYNYTLFLILFL